MKELSDQSVEGWKYSSAFSNWSKDTDMLRAVTVVAMVLEIRIGTMAPE